MSVKSISRSEEEYGFIRLPSEAKAKRPLREISVTVGSMRFEGVRVDRYARIWIGRSRMSEAGLRKGLKVRFEWISPSALKITPLDIPVTPDHDSVRDMLYEIGLLKGRIALREYPIEGMRVDVVWKRIEKGNPYIAFEVQIAGNFFEALTKLKHAWDLWNSIPFLVTTEEYIDKALKLVEGSFHEIKHVIRVVGWRSVEELYNLLKKVRELEAEMKLS